MNVFKYLLPFLLLVDWLAIRIADFEKWAAASSTLYVPFLKEDMYIRQATLHMPDYFAAAPVSAIPLTSHLNMI